ncbi:MAG: DUF429 domain-containing protein, partial [Spirochaetaceae bacterium]|nr:DUF429 domain-containing protein [Spirochaetaceae bacterium]
GVSRGSSRRAIVSARAGGREGGEVVFSDLNHRELGKRLSKQSASMVPKIAELDALMLGDADAGGKIREAHRELCFWGLNRGRPLTHAKTQPEGIEERRAVLSRYLPWAEEFLDDARAEMRPQLPPAVVVDAVATALTAVPAHPSLSGLRSIPTCPQRDARGLRMEMVYQRSRWPA